ncbi:glycosyltransferase family 4 protein [Microbulbifer sp. MCCC 1A16149]|uniref:glycosyltransferase family 4 protein n=1 Tax=Microbulbifer sp. MCCC 1A16149 TaxID=3411322 RepID=UPI003D09C7B6
MTNKLTESSLKYLLVQTAIGDYRQKVMDELVARLGSDLFVLVGNEYFEESTKTRVSLPDNMSVISNVFLISRKFLFQPSAIVPSIKAKKLIMELNPRIISVWFVLIARILLLRRTVLWGHAWPRGGKNKRSDVVRGLMRQLASHVLVYTDTQKCELKEKMPRKSISSAPNSIFSSADMWVPDRTRDKFIYVGRLVSAKKPRLMIRAYREALEIRELGDLIVIGDGPERKRCESLAAELGIEDRVKFLGHEADVNRLRELYAESVASLSPGYVGLSITQSFSFGTPMIISDDEPHAPEIEAASKNVNCLFFEADSLEDLARKMVAFWDGRSDWSRKSSSIIENCKERYSAEVMAERILEAFDTCKP